MMYYYYLFVSFHCYLSVRLCYSLPAGSLSLNHEKNDVTGSATDPNCPTSITYKQVAVLLQRYTCSSIQNSNAISDNNDRTRRQIDSGTLDIKALQTTVNDHRTMIQYLFKNNINATILMQELSNLSRTGPSLTSWRDWVDICCISLLLIMLMYLFTCRLGFSGCDRLIAFIFRPVLNRLQQQPLEQQHQMQQPQSQLTKPKQVHQQQMPNRLPKNTSEHLASISKIADDIQLSRDHPLILF